MGGVEKGERRRKHLYVSSVAEMKPEKCQWNLVAVLVTGAVLGVGGGEGEAGLEWVL